MKRNFFFILGFIAVLACSDDNSPATEAIDGNKLLEQASMPLNTAAIDSLLDHIGNSRYVLLGEASHGTAEFYTWRAEISKRLIQEKGFSVIAVEGDWPDLYRFNEYITETSGASAAYVLSQLDRWPSWM
jgi:erythromycin esterase